MSAKLITFRYINELHLFTLFKNHIVPFKKEQT